MITVSNCVLLHRRPYKENSIIAELWAQNQGRFSAVINGVRKQRSIRNQQLQPFHELVLHTKKDIHNNLNHIQRVEASNLTPLYLQQQALYCGLYLNELLLHFLPHGFKASALYMQYWQSLHLLDNSPIQWMQIPLRRFEVMLLKNVGILSFEQIDLSFAANYGWQPQNGFIQRSINEANSTPQISHLALMWLADGCPIEDWNAIQTHLQLLRECKLFMRHLIQQQLGFALKSHALFGHHKP